MLLSAQCKNLFSATQSRDLKVAAPLKDFSVFFGTTYFTKLFHSILISLVYKNVYLYIWKRRLRSNLDLIRTTERPSHGPCLTVKKVRDGGGGDENLKY